MKRFFAVLLSAFLLVGNAYATPLPERKTELDENVTFIIELEGNPSFVERKARRGGDLESITNEILKDHNKVMDTIKKEISSDAEEGYVYTTVFNGFSLDGKREQLDELKKLDGVKNVYISQKYTCPEPKLNNAESIANIDKVWDLGYTGEGQVITIVDEFCDVSHEFFQTEPTNPKYTKDDIDNILKSTTLSASVNAANAVYKNAKIPYAFNYANNTAEVNSQTKYHGTHVTGIAAGKNGKLPDGTSFSGIAPDAQVFFMNISDGTYMYDVSILAAINDAVALDTDVINMSFGAEYYDAANEPIYAQVLETAREAGISCLASAGNSSRGYEDATPLTKDMDYGTGGTPAGLNSVTSVASADNTAMTVYHWQFALENGEKVDLYSPFEGSTFDELFKNGKKEYVYCDLGYEADFAEKDLNGKIALIKRGENTFAEKITNAKAAGAIGVIFINTVESLFTISKQELPAAAVTLSLGNKLIDDPNKMLTFIETEKTTASLKNGGKISSFSSWGVDTSLQLKPEITAPGGNIYSSYPGGTYTYLSGTSMSSPYVAGAMALAREYYATSPYGQGFNGLENGEKTALLENIAMTSADIIYMDNGVPYSPRLQGAGLLDMEAFIKDKVIITGDTEKAKVSLGEIGDKFNVNFTVANISNETVNFDKISMELLTDGYDTENGANYVGDTVRIENATIKMPESLSVEPGEEAEFTAEIELDKNFTEANKAIFTNGFFVDGFVILQDNNGENYASVPFTGFYGDFSAGRIFDSTVYDEGGSSLALPASPYTSGTYLAAFIDDEWFYYVGRNSINKTIVDEKYISYASEGDLILTLVYKNYKATEKIYVSIKDENGNVVYEDEQNKASNKFRYGEYSFNGAKISSLKEGKYTICVGAVPLGKTEVTDTLELPLVIDNTNPELLSAKYDEETKILTISGRDNHYLNTMYLYYDNKYGGIRRKTVFLLKK